MSYFFNKLEREGSACSFVAVDCACHDEIVGSKEGLDVRKRNGCGLVDHHQVAVTDLVCVIREDELYKLLMLLEYLYSHNRLVVVFSSAINLIEVQSFFEI